MKKIILLSATLIVCIKMQAQYPCFNGISTNPINPVNNQFPAKKNTFFNWQDSLWAMQPSPFCFRTALNESPFYKIDNLEELRDAKDMKWEDGWELLRRYVGLTESNAYTVSNPEHLYVILYNKYTGILRVILMACRGADYNAAKIIIQFPGSSVMKTDLLEFGRDQISALDKVFSPTQLVAGVKYINENSKYFYADFPLMYDPCTCIYKSKINVVSQLISNATINIEGGITGEIHTKDIGGKAQVQKPGTYSWKDFNNTVNGRVTAIYGNIEKFRAATQVLAENIGRSDTGGKKGAIAQFANYLKTNGFLRGGLNAVPWLKSALSVIDVFSGGGNSSSGPQEVKLLPMAVNLTAKLSGTMSTANQYHDIVFTNPGSKDAVLDPDAYPYYNEVLGVFNLIKTPTLFVQSNYRTITDPETGNPVRITENRYRFDLTTLKYVLNPAADVTIQNMKGAIMIEGQNRNFPICAYSDHVIPPDFVYEGKDGITNTDKYRTDYYDMICLGSRMFQANSYYNSITASTLNNPLVDVGCPNAFISKGYIKFMINLKRNNATATTQNILFVATFPCKIVTDNTLPNYQTDYLCNDSSIVAPAPVTEVNTFCNSTAYYQTSRYNRMLANPLTLEQQLETEGFAISPNPNSGNFTIRFKQQAVILKAISIANLSGQRVFETKLASIQLSAGYIHQLRVSLPPGIYIVSYVTDKGIHNARMVITE